mmetsp:Transcript_18270/g.33951  ORF Transcript_18270/g.33951 Transcript_18270/m.33951 type:complete len:238 (+) Transcript_18270:1257-1970(+)
MQCKDCLLGRLLTIPASLDETLPHLIAMIRPFPNLPNFLLGNRQTHPPTLLHDNIIRHGFRVTILVNLHAFQRTAIVHIFRNDQGFVPPHRSGDGQLVQHRLERLERVLGRVVLASQRPIAKVELEQLFQYQRYCVPRSFEEGDGGFVVHGVGCAGDAVLAEIVTHSNNSRQVLLVGDDVVTSKADAFVVITIILAVITDVRELKAGCIGGEQLPLREEVMQRLEPSVVFHFGRDTS